MQLDGGEHNICVRYGSFGFTLIQLSFPIPLLFPSNRYQTSEEKAIAQASAKKLSKQSGKSVKTTISRMTTWTNAEDYHQKFELRRWKKLVHLLGKGEEEGLRESPLAAKLNGFCGGKGGGLGGEGARKAVLESGEVGEEVKVKILEILGAGGGKRRIACG